MKIIFPVLLIIVFLVIKLIVNYRVYANQNLFSIDFFIEFLRINGNSDNTLFENGVVFFSATHSEHQIELIKFKERDKSSVFLSVSFELIKNEKEKLEKKLEELSYNYFYLFNGKILVIDFDDIRNEHKELIEYIWVEIFYFSKVLFHVSFNNLMKSRKFLSNGKISDSTIPYEALDIPITNWQWILCKLKIKKYSGGCNPSFTSK